MALVDRLERNLAELRSELVATELGTELAAMLPDQEPDEVQVIAVGRDEVARDTQIHSDWELALSLQETPELDELHEQKVKRHRQGAVRLVDQAEPTAPADVGATGGPEGDAPVVTDSKQEEAAVDGHVLQCAHAS